MRRLLEIIRNQILLQDAYTLSQFTTVNGGASGNIQIKYSEQPVFPEGVLQGRKSIILSADSDYPHPVIPNVVESRFFIDFYDDKSFINIENMYYSQDGAVLAQYGLARGVAALLQNRAYNAQSDIQVQRFFQVNGPRYEIRDETKMYYASTQWIAHVVRTPSFQAA